MGDEENLSYKSRDQTLSECVAHLPNIMRVEDWDALDWWLYERGYWPCVRPTPDEVRARWDIPDPDSSE